MTHDQDFKNLILDYPRPALSLFRRDGMAGLDADVCIVTLRRWSAQRTLQIAALS